MTRLILTAHGSRDPRSAANARAVANQIRFMRPGLSVRVAFCDLNTPRLADVLTPDSVVTPFLLADAYHARIDIPQQIASSGLPVRQAAVLGEDDRLVDVLRARLGATGVHATDPGVGVMVVAIGSTHAAANARTALVADKLGAGTQWAGTATAFATTGVTSLADAADELRRHGAQSIVIAPWFLANGRLTDRVATYAAAEGITMAAPLGGHPLVAETVLDRFDAAIAQRAAA